MGDSSAKNTVSIKDSTLEAVKEGMLGYTQPGGQLYSYFRSCVVKAGAQDRYRPAGRRSDQQRRFCLLCPL